MSFTLFRVEAQVSRVSTMGVAFLVDRSPALQSELGSAVNTMTNGYVPWLFKTARLGRPH